MKPPKRIIWTEEEKRILKQAVAYHTSTYKYNMAERDRVDWFEVAKELNRMFRNDRNANGCRTKYHALKREEKQKGTKQ